MSNKTKNASNAAAATAVQQPSKQDPATETEQALAQTQTESQTESAPATPPPEATPKRTRTGISTEKRLAAFVLQLVAALDARRTELSDATMITMSEGKTLANESFGKALNAISARLTEAVTELQRLDFTKPENAEKGKSLMNEIARLQKKKAAIEQPAF